MRFGLLSATLGLAATAAAGQQPWSTEIGIQGGFARFKVAGTNRSDALDFYDIPGGAGPLGEVPTYNSVFMTIPTGRRIALQPSFRFSQYPDIPQTSATFGLRVNVALTGGWYAGAGGILSIISTSPVAGTSFSERQVGLHLAAGYRFPLTAALHGRVEAQTLFFHRTDAIRPLDVYALTFGLSTPVSRTARRRAGLRPGRWLPAIGLQAGYAWTHAVGTSGGAATFSFPSIGSSELGGFQRFGAPPPPTLFAIIPLTGRFALDAGLDAHLARSSTIFTAGGGIFTAQLVPRLDVGVTDRWYAGLGPAFQFVRAPFAKLSVVSGATVAWGYTFPLTAALGGRVEVGYTMYAAHRTLGFRAVNALAVSVGTTFPL